jgi:DNA-binding IclR family transcriptional regulator
MVVAAMNVSQPATQAMGYEAVEHLLPILRHAAERLSPALPR